MAGKQPSIYAALVGFVLLAGYAAVGILQVLVWNPLAAVPGATLDEIRADMERANETLGAPLVLTWAVAGALLAAAVVVATLLRPTTVKNAIVLDLLLLVLAAPSHWIASFPAGMGIADAFGLSGEDHAPWGRVLYATSAVALVALVLVLAWTRRLAKVRT